MRKLLLTALFFGLVMGARATPARADFGLGLFIGEPTGLDMKVGLNNKSGLDILLGWTTFRDGRAGYGHLTYLVTPIIAQATSFSVPLRVGIGAAIANPSDDVTFAVRAPFEVGLRFRTSPLELYGEIALALSLINPQNDLHIDVQGGGGLRIYF